jgi:hypothetical protein
VSDLHEGEKPVEPILAQTFEGMAITKMEGVLPMVTLEMPEGYPVGTHLRFEVEVRVANVRFEEGKGRHAADFSRKHVLVTEGVQLTAAFLPSELDSAVVGTAAGVANLVEDEDEQPEQIAEFEELPLDPAFQTAVETPGTVETLDEQISRMAEEQAAEFAVADEEKRLAMASDFGVSIEELTKSFNSFGRAMRNPGMVIGPPNGSGVGTVMTSGTVLPDPNRFPEGTYLINMDPGF